MKSRLKLVIYILLFIAVNKSFAQTYTFKMGYNLSFLHVDFPQYKPKLGTQLGATASISLTNTLSIEPGLLFTDKGFMTGIQITDADGEPIGTPLSTRISILYIEFPLQLRAAYDMGKNKVFFNAGPYISKGLSGQLRNSVLSYKLMLGTNGLSKLDYGMRFGGGVSFKSVEVGLVCDYGLVRLIQPNELLDMMCFGMTLGYVFNN